MPITRRTFLSAAGATGLSTFWRPIRAQERHSFRTALVGCGAWGMKVLHSALDSGSCKPVALCDVDARLLDGPRHEISKKSGATVKAYTDYSDMLKAVRPEIVIVATPSHAHAQQATEAVNAGAHVYVEQPVGVSIPDGRAMVNAARESGRVMQVGLQRRVSEHTNAAREFIQAGRAGKIGMVRAIVDSPVAPGQMDSWSVDWMDQVLWVSGEQAPKSVFSADVPQSIREGNYAPDAQVVCYEFEKFTAVWQQRFYNGPYAERSSAGCFYYGTEGTVLQGWHSRATFFPADRMTGTLVQIAPQTAAKEAQDIKTLWMDFVRCIRDGGTPIADIEHGHRATTMSELGALSLKVDRAIQWDSSKERCIGDEAANTLIQKDCTTVPTNPAFAGI